MKKAFTMLELVFVIVIIGILSAISLPNFFDMKFKSDLARLKSEVNSIQAKVKAEYVNKIMSGDTPSSYDSLGNDTANNKIFTNIYKDGFIEDKTKGWELSTPKTYIDESLINSLKAEMGTNYIKFLEDLLKKNKIKERYMELYKYRLNSNITFTFSYLNFNASFRCVKLDCKNCGGRKQIIESMIDCDE